MTTLEERIAAESEPPNPNRPAPIVIQKPATPTPPAGIVPKPVRRPGPKDIATLEVRGQYFTNWTSVRVEQRWIETFPIFQFECTEEVTLPLSINTAQFVPGDVVRVLLGGHSAVYGYITERHVGYDGANHGVRLIGVGNTADLVNSSVPLDKLSGHDGKTVQQLATDLAAHLEIQIHTHGSVDGTPFEKMQVQPGETPMQAIERYAKMRSIIIGSEANGGLLLIGEHPTQTSGMLAESVNILRANCVWRDQMIYKKIFTTAQGTGSEARNGDPQNKQVAERDGSSTRNRHMVVVADVADTMHGVQRRADMEYLFTEGSELEAHITVQGWFKDHNLSEDIWRAGEYYVVHSPSLILHDRVLGCAGCVYEQNQGGTTTTLQMVKPEHMNGRFNYAKEEMEARAKAAADKEAAEKEAREKAEREKEAVNT